ncbi:MAG TPA: hypothetical protein VNU01_12270, partial [Egibacteraceae bacterium]|nr:hypothetical protein [Egibacteraceae bacterium]
EQVCPAERLAVSWREPDDSYQWGAHVEPIGPAPGAATTAVNGVVLCQDAGFAFMGFEAWRADGTWQLAAVPYVREEGEAHPDEAPGGDHPHRPAPAEPAPAPPAPARPATPPALSLDLPSGSIEGYAAYEPQRLCDPGPKPGTLALRNLLLGTNPGTRNLGIGRSCGAGGQSEHKEGRALDWGVLVSRPAERAAADRFVAQLMATDAQGNPHAMARRMGVMYVIWNRQIWSAYRPAAGWRAYGGPSPHTDHVHVSLSWAGAMGRTSFWSGKVDPATLLAHQPVPASGGSAGSGGTGSGGGSGTHQPIPASLPTEAVRDAVRERRKDRRGDHVTEPRPETATEAGTEAEAARRAEREQRRRERFDERAERRALRAAERAKRHADEAERQAAERQEAERQEAERQAAEAEAERREAAATAPRHRGEQRPGGNGNGQAEAERAERAERNGERQRKAQVKAERRQERKAEADGTRGGKGHGTRGGKGHGKGKGGAKGRD